MKNILIWLGIFFSHFFVFSQANIEIRNDFLLSKFEKENFSNFILNIRKKLNINDSTLILSLDQNRIISIDKDSLNLFKIYNHEIISNRKLSIKKIDSKELLNNLFELNPTELIVENQGSKNLKAVDGHEYNISVFMKNKVLELKSYAPETYIENKFPYYEKRKTFLDIYKNLNNLFYDELYYRIVKSDQIFILFEENISNSKVINVDKKVVTGKIRFNFKNINFISTSDSSIVKKNDFLNKTIVNYKNLNEYSINELNALLKENRKKIFILEECKRTKRKLKVTEVKII